MPLLHMGGLRGRVRALSVKLVVEVELKVVRLMRQRRAERAEVSGEAPVGLVNVRAVSDGRLDALVAEARNLSLHLLRILPRAGKGGGQLGPGHVLALE